jgi:hypothetical protein
VTPSAEIRAIAEKLAGFPDIAEPDLWMRALLRWLDERERPRRSCTVRWAYGERAGIVVTVPVAEPERPIVAGSVWEYEGEQMRVCEVTDDDILFRDKLNCCIYAKRRYFADNCTWVSDPPATTDAEKPR